MLYLFAGQARKGDVRSYLHELQGTDCHVDIEEFDLERGQNLLADEVWLPLLRRVKNGDFSLLLLSPPCHTWSRAPWSNDSGPRPLRSSDWPTGFPWLKGADKTKVDEGTEFITRSLEIIQVAHQQQVPWLIEHPEDLGPTARGTPASIWSWETSRKLFEKLQATTVALHQCAYGSDYRKPTRFTGTWHGLPSLGFAGWPVFRNLQYVGPLPRQCGHKHPPLVGRTATGAFQTAPTAAYGPGLCQALANLALKTASTSALKKGTVLTTDEAAVNSAPTTTDPEKLAAHFLERGTTPTEDMVLQVFDLLPGEAPSRGQVTEDSKSFVVGSYSVGGGLAGLRRNTKQFPSVSRLLCDFVKSLAKDFLFSCVGLFRNLRTGPC